MLKQLLIALCALFLGSLAAPALAEGEGDWGLIETTPADWPVPIYLPDYGELTMVGFEGATRADVTEPFDFEWTYEAEEGSGEIYLIQGFFMPDEPGDASSASAEIWENYAAELTAQLEASGVSVLSLDAEAQYGGRRWLMYELSEPDEESGEALELLTLVNFGDGGMTFLNVFADMPVNEDFDGMLSLITGGPDAPQ